MYIAFDKLGGKRVNNSVCSLAIYPPFNATTHSRNVLGFRLVVDISVKETTESNTRNS